VAERTELLIRRMRKRVPRVRIPPLPKRFNIDLIELTFGPYIMVPSQVLFTY
jgi:hypothetical protein